MDGRFLWCGHEWITAKRYGLINQNKPYCWYDNSAVHFNLDKSIILKTHKNPRYFNNLKISSPVGVGLISCTTKFGHGRFSIETKMPSGPNLCPAFWMWSWDSLPPEINVFEGYTNSKGSYFKMRFPEILGFWNIQNNVHYKGEADNKMSWPKNHWISAKSPDKEFIEYAVEWRPDRLDFFWNGRKVRTLKDKNILNQLNSTTMNVIINNSITSEADLENPPYSEFVVRNFSYYKL